MGERMGGGGVTGTIIKDTENGRGGEIHVSNDTEWGNWVRN